MLFNTQQESTLNGCVRVQPMNTMETQFKPELPLAPRTQQRSHCRGGEAKQSEPLNCSSVSIFTAKKALKNHYSIITINDQSR